MGTLAHGRGAMRRNAERRGGVGFSRVEDVANGTSPVGYLVVGPGAKPKGGVGRIAARRSKPGVWEVSQWEAGQSGNRRSATVLPAPSRTVTRPTATRITRKDRIGATRRNGTKKSEISYPSHSIVRSVAPVGAIVGLVPPICNPTHDDAPHKPSHLVFPPGGCWLYNRQQQPATQFVVK